MKLIQWVLPLIILCVPSGFSSSQIQVSREGNVETLAKNFVNLLVKEEYASAALNFDAAVSAALSPQKLRETWESLIMQVGAFKKERSVRTAKVAAYDVVYVSCEFGRADLDVKVVYNSTKQIAGLFFVPTEANPQAGAAAPSTNSTLPAREVLIGSGDWALHGTLIIPEGEGPFPAVVLVHGSGPQDRDETIGPNKPFRDLAEGLAAKGIAVLRYEKRTKEHAAQLVPLKDSITVKEETIDDVLLAVSLLRNTGRIDPKKIFVLGHSLGGMMIPRIGLRDSGIAGLIVMAGTSRPLEDVILDQMSYIFSLDSTISESQKSQLEIIRSQVARVKDPKLTVATPSTDLPLGIPARYWLDLRGYNPPKVALTLKQPMLIVQGERDYQVTMDDFAGWKKYLSARSNVQFRTYPKLNHLFIEGEGRSTPQEYGIAGHVAESVIDDIAAWIRK